MFECIESYRNATIPAPEIEGVTLTCSLGSGLSDRDIPVDAAGQLREFWRRTSGGLLLVESAD